MRNRLTFIVLLIFTLFSCDLLTQYDLKRFDVAMDENIVRPCIYAYYYNNNKLQVEISATRPTTNYKRIDFKEANIKLSNPSSTTVYIDTTVVLLYKEDVRQSNKVTIPIEYFKKIPETDETLKISIKIPLFDTITGAAQIPQMPETKTITAQKLNGEEIEYLFKLPIKNRKNIDNYYLITSSYKLINYYDKTYKIDTTTTNHRYRIPLTDPIFDFLPSNRTSVTEPFAIDNYKPRIFDGRVFGNAVYNLKIQLPVYNYDYYISPKDSYSSTYYIELFAISKELFKAYKNNYMARIIEGDIYAEPLTAYSNMSNEIGFFGVLSKPSMQGYNLPKNDVLNFGVNL